MTSWLLIEVYLCSLGEIVGLIVGAGLLLLALLAFLVLVIICFCK